jgi:protein TonB
MSATKDVAAEEQTATPVFVEQAAAAPPPPPPPAAPPASQSAQPEVPTPVQVEPQKVPEFAQPTEVPDNIPEPIEDVTPVQSPVTTESLPTGDRISTSPLVPGVSGGVAGGVEGGVTGGVVGGEVGGVVGGLPGGVVGGQVGGVPGGDMGGIPGGSADGASNAMPTGPVRVGGNVKAPRVVHRTDPEYTEVARKGRVKGVVVVEAIIDRQGNVDQVKVIKGLPLGLSEAAAEAVRKWKFKPGTMGGQPVDVIFNLTVTFTLDGSARAEGSSGSDSE